MKKQITLLILLTLLVAACGAKAAADNQSANSTPTIENSAKPPQSTQAATASNAGRQASITEFHNDVQVRLVEGGDISPAQKDMIIPIGGSVQTGDNSRVGLKLLPGGTIIRVAPNSTFTVKSIDIVDGKPKTTIQLFFGKIWILLAGGQLDVQTKTGVASVRGSLLSVEFDPQTNEMNASCLEGECGLQDDTGQNEVDLTDGQTSSVGEDGDIADVEQMTDAELQDWVNENPESVDFFNGNIPDWLPEPDPNFNPLEDSSNIESTTEPEATEAPGDTQPPDDNINPPDDSGGSDKSGGGDGGDSGGEENP